MAAEVSPIPVPYTGDVSVLDGLTMRQKLFCEYYSLYGIGEKAMRLAQYSEGSMEAYASRLLAQDKIKAAIQYYREVHAAQGFYTPEKVVKQWGEMADVNISDCFDNHWRLLPKDQWPDALKHALTGFEIRYGKDGAVTVKPRFAKVEALAALARHYGVEKADAEASGETGTTLSIAFGSRENAESGEGETVKVGSLTINTKRSK